MQELDFSFIGQRIKEIRTGKKPVSYTHLTLPTNCT